jgi:hypothetical protein
LIVQVVLQHFASFNIEPAPHESMAGQASNSPDGQAKALDALCTTFGN